MEGLNHDFIADVLSNKVTVVVYALWVTSISRLIVMDAMISVVGLLSMGKN